MTSTYHLESLIVWEAVLSSAAPSLALGHVFHLSKTAKSSSCDLWSESGTVCGAYVSVSQNGTWTVSSWETYRGNTKTCENTVKHVLFTIHSDRSKHNPGLVPISLSDRNVMNKENLWTVSDVLMYLFTGL